MRMDVLTFRRKSSVLNEKGSACEAMECTELHLMCYSVNDMSCGLYTMMLIKFSKKYDNVGNWHALKLDQMRSSPLHELKGPLEKSGRLY